MATLKRRESTSLLRFARNHLFVTIFGVVVSVVLFLCLIGYPIVYTIYLSFFEWNGMSLLKKFVGFANYVHLSGDKYFYVALLNNLRWLVVSLVFPVTLGFLIAYAMRARLVFFPSFLRTAVFFPVTMSLIAVGLMFLLILIPPLPSVDSIFQARPSSSVSFSLA